MNFDKFRTIDPKPSAFDVKDEKYADRLCALQPRRKSNIIPILGTVAAALIVVIGVTVWAIIGRGVRGPEPTGDDAVIVPADDSTVSQPQPDEITDDNIIGSSGQDQQPEPEPEQTAEVISMDDLKRSDEPAIKWHENGDISFNRKDAYIVGYTDDYIVLRPQSMTASYYIQVMTDTRGRDIILNDKVYMMGDVIRLAESIPCETETGDPITYKTADDFKIAYMFDTSNISAYENIVYAGDGYVVFAHQNRYIRMDTDIADLCVGDRAEFKGRASEIEPQTLTLNDGTTVSVTYEMKHATLTPQDMITIAKPVIYLYPEQKTDVSVSVDIDGELTCVYPEYDGMWQVTAEPDGTLTDNSGRQYYCLYWEADIFDSLVPDKSTGFVVKGEDTAEFLREKALALGLTEKEANEFIIYWLPMMEDNAYNYVYFSIDEYKEMARLNIEPGSDTSIRFAMLWQALDAPIEVTEQKLPETPKRQGFTVVEWGGAQIE